MGAQAKIKVMIEASVVIVSWGFRRGPVGPSTGKDRSRAIMLVDPVKCKISLLYGGVLGLYWEAY